MKEEDKELVDHIIENNLFLKNNIVSITYNTAYLYNGSTRHEVFLKLKDHSREKKLVNYVLDKLIEKTMLKEEEGRIYHR